MFTGLIEDIGRITRAERRGEAVELAVAPRTIACRTLALGESIAIDGCCLTVTSRAEGEFTALAGPETLARTIAGTYTVGARVNLERALPAGGRLGGHIVAGHVDGVGDIERKVPTGPAVDITFRPPRELLRYVVKKGSIAVDGISLTVNRVDEYAFAVALIPHTLEHTTLGEKPVGAKVNLEVDVVAKYVEKLVGAYRR